MVRVLLSISGAWQFLLMALVIHLKNTGFLEVGGPVFVQQRLILAVSATLFILGLLLSIIYLKYFKICASLSLVCGIVSTLCFMISAPAIAGSPHPISPAGPLVLFVLAAVVLYCSEFVKRVGANH